MQGVPLPFKNRIGIRKPQAQYCLACGFLYRLKYNF